VRKILQMRENFSLIEKKIGYDFQDLTLLETAFVHRSFINENRGVVKEHNERLEFLGDAVLGLIVSKFLYTEFPELPEGDLSYLRSRLVEATTCAFYIEKMALERYILMGKGEAMNEGKGRLTILADLFEALIGAIYLDGGMEAAQTFFFDHFKEDILTIIRKPMRNWKAELQDYCQKNYQTPPTYEVVDEEGPDHNKTFYMIVKLGDEVLGQGIGSSKKEAEQKGAKEAVMKLEQM
jgi:ribonuclease-3